ncbi:MAG: carboxypeptidase-like regulatory domain-containing protein [Rhodanobacter sp.]
MHKLEYFKGSNHPWSFSLRNAAIVIALGVVSFMSASTVYAQSTSATIFGQAPAGAIVTASSSTGVHRHQTVKKTGHYKIDGLPDGDYTVTLEKDTQTVDTRSNISLLVGRNAEVDFACPNDQCAASEN